MRSKCMRGGCAASPITVWLGAASRRHRTGRRESNLLRKPTFPLHFRAETPDSSARSMAASNDPSPQWTTCHAR
jgi:hypothetical protein